MTIGVLPVLLVLAVAPPPELLEPEPDDDAELVAVADGQRRDVAVDRRHHGALVGVARGVLVAQGTPTVGW